MLRWSKPTSTDVKLGVDVLVLRWSKPTSTDAVLSGLDSWVVCNGVGPCPCLVLVVVQSYIATVEAMERGVAGGVGSQGSVFAMANVDAEPDVAAVIPIPDNIFGSLGSS